MFESLAALLLPADPDQRGAVVQADDRWRFDASAVQANTVVWGRPPLPAGSSPWDAARAAVRRTRALRGLQRRPPRPFRIARVHPLPPARLVPALGRDVIRDLVLGGALVELSTGTLAWRVCDAAAAAAGCRDGLGAFAAGAGGSMLSRIRMPDGTPALLRVAGCESPGDPRRAAEALRRLAGAAIARVPRLEGSGRAAPACWSLESWLPGRRPAGLSDELGLSLARFCAQLPPGSGPPVAHRADLGVIAAALPALAQPMQHVAGWLDRAVAALPAVTRHGDLWAGNIRVDGDGLAGVIDWDAWHEAGVPGADLVHLLSMDQALRTRRELGQVWTTRPWRSARFQRVTAPYWAGLGIEPTADRLDAIGIAWWATYVAHGLSRDPTLAAHEGWVRLNVHDVLAALERAGVTRPATAGAGSGLAAPVGAGRSLPWEPR